MTPYPRINSFEIDPARFSAMMEEFRAYSETEEKKMPNDYEEMEQESRLYPWIDDEGQEWVDNWDLGDDEDYDDDEEWDEEYEDDGQPSEYDEWQDVYGGDDWDHGQYDNGE